MEDMLGLSPRVPKFVKEFGRVGAAIEGAISRYAEEVRAKRFPDDVHSYTMRDDDPPVAATGHEKAENTGHLSSLSPA